MDVLQMDNARFLPHVSQLVDEGHTVTIRARGNSMRPFIESDRDSVVLGKADMVTRGDVVLAEISTGHYVLHRVDTVDAWHVQLRGDGNPYQTELCTPVQIRAKVVTVIRKGREYSTSGRVWKCYSVVWMRLLPLRRYLLALYRLLWRGEIPARFRLKQRQ